MACILIYDAVVKIKIENIKFVCFNGTVRYDHELKSQIKMYTKWSNKSNGLPYRCERTVIYMQSSKSKKQQNNNNRKNAPNKSPKMKRPDSKKSALISREIEMYKNCVLLSWYDRVVRHSFYYGIMVIVYTYLLDVDMHARGSFECVGFGGAIRIIGVVVAYKFIYIAISINFLMPRSTHTHK